MSICLIFVVGDENFPSPYSKIYSKMKCHSNFYTTFVTKITLTKIVLVANAHAGPSNNARPASEMTAIALPARYALKPQLLPYDDTIHFRVVFDIKFSSLTPKNEAN
jgi:hypothetical protein